MTTAPVNDLIWPSRNFAYSRLPSQCSGGFVMHVTGSILLGDDEARAGVPDDRGTRKHQPLFLGHD